MSTEELLDEVERKVRWYALFHDNGVVHVRRGSEVVVDDKLEFEKNEIAVVFFNHGEYYVVISTMGDDGPIELAGDSDYVWRRMEARLDAAQTALRHNPSNEYAKYKAFLADVFFAVDNALNGEE